MFICMYCLFHIADPVSVTTIEMYEIVKSPNSDKVHMDANPSYALPKDGTIKMDDNPAYQSMTRGVQMTQNPAYAVPF